MTNQLQIIGIDLGKHWFHLIGLDRDGAIVLRKKLSRSQLSVFAATTPRRIVAMESCCGSQYWGRVFAQAGHEVRLAPAQFVKPYVKTNKNDFNDAEAIAEAASRATMRFVPLKTIEQLELQASHRIRRRLVHERTAVINQLRSLLLEYGIVTPTGRETFARRWARILDTASVQLSPRLLVLMQRLRDHWRTLDTQIAEATQELTTWAEGSPLCQRVATVPGVGPMIATAVVSAVGDARMFARGRDMAAWLGLVPRQHSTGGKPTLGRISRRGNGYLRQLFLQGAVSAYLWMKRDRSALGAWVQQLDRRRQRPVVITALANKLVRICWKVLTSETPFRLYPARPVEHAV
jgi:transposase